MREIAQNRLYRIGYRKNYTIKGRTLRLVVSVDDSKMACQGEGRQVSSNSLSLVRAGELEGARKWTRVDSSYEIP